MTTIPNGFRTDSERLARARTPRYVTPLHSTPRQFVGGDQIQIVQFRTRELETLGLGGDL